MPGQAFSDVMTDWDVLVTTVTANKDDLPALDAYRQELETEAATAKAANVRQSTAQAAAQQATKDLGASLQRGKDLADQIRFGIKSKYGKRNEKLKEFGLKVFRGKKKKSPTETPPPGGSTQGTSPPPQGGSTQGTSPPPASPPAGAQAASQGATSEPHNPT